ncbi:UNVERIFIED_ORG: luciferase-type oxidoreductase [Variovorax paradoxus]|nr:luciferase-type oxidoreductase [Variovorax paradoxus]
MMLDSSPRIGAHPGFARAFAPGRLTLGFILPLEAYPSSPAPLMEHHAELTRMADELGFATLWARDVPAYDPSFGDVGQMFDPFTYLGFLAANTKRIGLATGAAVITLRHPVHVAKQAASIDVMSGGRMLLGVASGDRPSEYPLFNIPQDYESRGDRFQEALASIRMASENSFPVGGSRRFGQFLGNLDVLPKPSEGRLPIVVVGRSRQDLDWIARNADAWLYYFVDARRTELIAATWRQAVRDACGEVFKPFAQGLFFDLLADPDAPVQPIHSGMAAGRHALIGYLEQLRDVGVNHVAFNLKASRRPAREVLQELGEFVLPLFASGPVKAQ